MEQKEIPNGNTREPEERRVSLSSLVEEAGRDFMELYPRFVSINTNRTDIYGFRKIFEKRKDDKKDFYVIPGCEDKAIDWVEDCFKKGIIGNRKIKCLNFAEMFSDAGGPKIEIFKKYLLNLTKTNEILSRGSYVNGGGRSFHDTPEIKEIIYEEAEDFGLTKSEAQTEQEERELRKRKEDRQRQMEIKREQLRSRGVIGFFGGNEEALIYGREIVSPQGGNAMSLALSGNYKSLEQIARKTDVASSVLCDYANRFGEPKIEGGVKMYNWNVAIKALRELEAEGEVSIDLEQNRTSRD